MDLSIYIIVETAGYPQRGGQCWEKPTISGPFHSWGAAARYGGWPNDYDKDTYDELLPNGLTHRKRIIKMEISVTPEPNSSQLLGDWE